MPEIICIKKNGNLKSIELSSLNSLPINLDSLSKTDIKKLKPIKGYSSECDFNLDDYTVTILGKTNGKAGSENKKELPPPIDNEIYFGNVYAIAHHNESYVDLSISNFENFYDSAFGGFEDIGDEESWSDEVEEDTDDREFINDDTESPKKDIEEESEEYKFSEDDETTDEEKHESTPDKNVNIIKEELYNSNTYDDGFVEGKKYYYLVQQLLRELDISLPKRRKQFYALCPQELGEIIYTNHLDKKDNIIEWLEAKIKSEELGGVKVIYRKFLKRYKADFMK